MRHQYFGTSSAKRPAVTTSVPRSISSFLRKWILLLSTTIISHSVVAASPPRKPSSSSPGQARLINAGKKLFFDRSISSDGQVSCASCHNPEKYFSDGLPVSIGVNGHKGTRNAPSLINVAFNKSMFWDGRTNSLEEQALEPFLNPREMGLKNQTELLEKIRINTNIASPLMTALGIKNAKDLKPKHVAHALAAYERTLRSRSATIEQFRKGEGRSLLNQAAYRGYKVFTNSAECASCHRVDNKEAPLTDNQFHTLSVGLERINEQLSTLVSNYYTRRAKGESVDQIILSNNDFAELGRFVTTLKPEDIGKFRTPSLLNVAKTAPYMHDGSIPTLEEAVDREIYYRSLQRGRPLIVTPAEKADLIAFLNALTEN